MISDIYRVSVTTIDGRTLSMAEYRGRVLLIVNVASQCGFTPQYTGLEALHRQFVDRGLSVLGFPCNQFGGQEPGSEPEIRRFCTEQYEVTFPLFAKVEVKGPRAHPLFRYLTSQRRGVLGTAAIKWNFTKFLVDRDGRVLRRFGSSAPPARIRPEIERVLSG